MIYLYEFDMDVVNWIQVDNLVAIKSKQTIKHDHESIVLQPQNSRRRRQNRSANTQKNIEPKKENDKKLLTAKTDNYVWRTVTGLKAPLTAQKPHNKKPGKQHANTAGI